MCTCKVSEYQCLLHSSCIIKIPLPYSPSYIVTEVRNALRTGPFEDKLGYWTGMMLLLSIILTGSAVLANYTAFGVFRCIGEKNATMILRSDIGLYAATLPSRLTFASLMTFLAWNGTYSSAKSVYTV